MATRSITIMGMVLLLAAPTQAAAPPFSWDTLPVFIQIGNNTGPFNDAAVDVLAKFDMVVLDKWQGPCGQRPNATPACDEESTMLAEARRIKRVNPNVSTLLYWNSILDFPQYTLHAKMLARPELMLHDNSTGDIVRLDGGGHLGMDVFDFANPAARALFMSDCVNATLSGVVDGCYLDRATGTSPVVNLSTAQAQAYEDGHITMLNDLQATLGDGPVVGNGAYGPPHDRTNISFAQLEEFSALKSGGKGNLSDLFTGVKNGRGMLVHTMVFPTESIIAAFLIGAGPRSYFGFGSWSTVYEQLSQRWSPLFDFPLGPPLGDAILHEKSNTYHRQFVHVNVSFDMETGKGDVAGWTFPPPPKPPPLPPAPPAPKCCAAETGCLYSGGNIEFPATPLHSAAECCASCGANPTCKFWSFSVSSKICKLHTGNARKSKDGPGTPVRVCGTGC
jgi:hypothetical protein